MKNFLVYDAAPRQGVSFNPDYLASPDGDP